jgi:hypothetical protein
MENLVALSLSTEQMHRRKKLFNKVDNTQMIKYIEWAKKMRRPKDKSVTNEILDEDTVPGEQFKRQPLVKYEKIRKNSESFLRV